MADTGEHELTCADCGVTITGVPVVPTEGTGPTRAQIEKLKPTVYLCAECAKDRGLSFDDITVGTPKKDATPPTP